jgi:predicted alpha/beta-hydrolase family hydrolase
MSEGMSEPFAVEIAPDQTVTAIAYPAAKQERSAITLILGHGAGAGPTSAFMVSFAGALAARGIDTVTFNFLYTEQGRRLPDPKGKLEACYRAVIAAVAQRKNSADRLAIGGKSMGGRIASQVAADGAPDVVGLVFLGYPLHPPGKPDQLRARHLPDIEAPMLFVQGERDTFGTPDELRPVIKTLKAPATLHAVAGGDHSFKVLKRGGVTQEDTYKAVLDRIDLWLRQTLAM